MLIRRTRRLVFQPRQYESIDISATIEFDKSEAGNGTVERFANDWLDTLLKDEMDEAAAVTETKSFISTYRFKEEEK